MPFVCCETIDKEIRNAQWRVKQELTNKKYLKRRPFRFFCSTLGHLNELQTLKKRQDKLGKKQEARVSAL